MDISINNQDFSLIQGQPICKNAQLFEGEDY